MLILHYKTQGLAIQRRKTGDYYVSVTPPGLLLMWPYEAALEDTWFAHCHTSMPGYGPSKFPSGLGLQSLVYYFSILISQKKDNRSESKFLS